MSHRKPLQTLALALALCGWLAAGCSSSKPVGWNVSITKATPATIPVDLIGIQSADETEWKGRSITEYWSPGSKLRQEADKLSYNLKLGEPVVLSRTDPKWKEWFSHGANELLIIANLPGDFSAGGEDPRRKFLPLRAKDWNPATSHTLEIEVQTTKINVLTPRAY